MNTKLIALFLLLVSPSLAAGELEQLSWLTGHWVTADGAAEESWLEPRGGTMTGQFRWVFPNGNQVLEYLVIEEKDTAITFRFKHYGTDFVPWEKDLANTYRLVEMSENKVIFELEHASHPVPQRYQYQRSGDTLTFRGESEGEEPLVIEFQRR
jgi:hypothetical protein